MPLPRTTVVRCQEDGGRVDKDSLVKGISAGSIAFGVAGAAAPALLIKTYRSQPTPTARFLARLWGSRNLTLGVLMLQLEGKARDDLLRLGIAMSALDSLLGLLAAPVDGLPASTGVAAAATSATFAGLFAYSLQLG